MPTIPSQYQIGQLVDSPAFVDRFGKPCTAVCGLVVRRLRYMPNDQPLIDLAFKPYWRVYAECPDTCRYVEGAERFFVPAAVALPPVSNQLGLALVRSSLLVDAGVMPAAVVDGVAADIGLDG